MNECDVFMTALDMESPTRRSAYLEQACGPNRMLRARIEALLASYSDAGSLLERPAADAPATRHFEPVAKRPGSAVGPYRLLKQIGEGGMGVVFLAEQDEPVKRTVALKLIKPGMDSRQAIARFAAEKQALAQMDHPNIARMLDAGTTAPTEGGYPGRYFVMELVEGVPITEYCDAHRFPLRARLELMVQICQAVQHAHQKGIIHRDLKPSNVLIGVRNGQPWPKIIDFGVAKATDPKLTAATLLTEVGQVVGTLEYMSPEQAELNQSDVDTRSDIYSLGVLLYELLTGTTPHQRQRLKRTPVLNALRLIREEEPPRPSIRLAESETLPMIAVMRGLEPKRLIGLMRGELDWIAMKCLEKDREHRYETAGSLASDIQHYLCDEPVRACPPSGAYRFRKFARKHRSPIAVALSFAAVLIAAVIVSTSLAIQASQASARARANEQRALEKEREALASAEAARQAADAQRAARRHAQVQSRRALAVSKSLLRVVRLPELAQNDRVSTILAAAAREVQEEFDDSPTKGHMLHIIAESYYGLKLYPEAITLWEAARDCFVRTLGPDHPTALSVSGNLAVAYKSAGRLDDAGRLFEDALDRMQRILGPDHRQTRITIIHLGETYRKAGRPDRALPFALDGFKLAEATLGLHHSDTHWAMTNLADVYFAVSRPDDAFRLHEECVDRTAADLGADDAQTIASRQMLAAKYASHGRLADAASEYACLFHNKPDDHGIALRAALLNGATGDWGNYDAVCRQMLDRFANTDSGWAANRTSLACLLSSPPVGETKRLVRLADFAVAACDENGTPADQVNSRRTRGLAAYRTGDFQGALKWCHESRNLEAPRAESSSYLATLLVIEAMAWFRNGNPAEARAAFDESDRIICQRFPDAPANVGADWFNWLMHDLLRREAVELLGLQDAADAIRARSDRHAPTDAADSSPTHSVEMDN